MKNYIILLVIFCSFITLAYSGLFDYDLLGGTQLNGSGCVCHTVEQDTSVSVWIEGPDTLKSGETGIYRMYLANGPAEAGGYNVAGRYGIMSLVDTFSVWHDLSPNELTQAFPLVFPTPQDTIYWEFAYTVPDSVLVDTLYSCGLSLVYDHVPDFLDRWNFGPKFPIVVIEEIVPVEFVSFSSSIGTDYVLLKWETATEINNSGFEIQRMKVHNIERSKEWESIGFINGNGTTSEPQSYSFTDENLDDAEYQYRLKQIDFNGSFQYSNTIEVKISSIEGFILEQNYPNPFNPTTKISWQSPIDSWQSIKVYDVLGNEFAVLVNEYKVAGNYNVKFDAKNFTSGIYFYKLSIGNREVVKKMILMR